MFQGIANQITEAQKETQKQEALLRYNQLLEKNLKAELRKQKKAETALGRKSIPGFDAHAINQYSGLKSFFFAVFEKQEKEKEKKRAEFIESSLYYNASSEIIDFFKDEQQKLAKQLKAPKEVKSLQRIVSKIKSGTLDKYYYQEVSTMFQFVDRSARIEAVDEELGRVINMGEEALTILRKIIKDLKQEENWGSWEDFFSKNSDPDKIPPTGMDFAYEKAPQADARTRAFSMLVEPFIEGRDMKLHAGNLQDLIESFINNMVYDWKYNSKPKNTLSKTSQTLNSLNMVLHGLNSLQEQNKNEKSLMEIEREKRIKKTEEYVKQKLSERI
ncbi:MAG: hypothetical protein R6U46_06975 [Marinilabilia sp.]